MYIRRFAAIAAVSLLAGCAIHPEPEDVTGVTTAGIVKQIRCETRDAARAVILRRLEDLATRGDQRAQSLLSQYQVDPESMTGFNQQLSFPGEGYRYVRDVFDVIYSAAIAYNFDLTMNEVNNLGTAVNLLGLGKATLNLGFTGAADRFRQNQRQFTITDKFSYLLTTLNTPKGDVHYCDGHIAVRPNYIYPMVGKIGIYNTVYTFFQLSFFDNLAPDPTKPGVGGTPAMGDILTFTTEVHLNLIVPTTTPPGTVVFGTPAAKTGFQITDASLTGALTRKDMHVLTVGLALDSKGTSPLTSLRGFVFSPERTAGVSGTRVAVGGRPAGSQVLVLNRVIASTASNAEQIAVNMIDQLKSRELQLIPPPPP